MTRIKSAISLYGSLVVYFGMYSLMWMYIRFGDKLGYREPYSFFFSGLVSGFVGVLAIILFNLFIWKPDILKGESKLGDI